MLRADGIVKILDFGLAKLTEKRSGDAGKHRLGEEDDTLIAASQRLHASVSPITEPGVVMGTVAYMSPEQARGKDTDARTDIFSLGTVIYEMLTRQMPYPGETTSDVIAAILMAEPPLPSKLYPETPAELERIILKTLVKDREGRYQTAKDLLIDLRRLKNQLEIETEIGRAIPTRRNDGVENATRIIEPLPTSSSAEYIVGEIRQHKFASVAAFSILLLVLGGLSFWYFGRHSVNIRQIESIAVSRDYPARFLPSML
jgi:serine/threonine protein kinase